MTEPSTQTTARPWWTGFFDNAYADVGLEPATEQAEASRQAAADFLVSALDLRPGDRVFDQCCGVGRLSVPLAQRGLRVTGVDLTEAYVERARRRATEHGLDCSFHLGDAGAFVAPEPCDGAFNWFTSFGYSRDDDVNARHLARAFESLRPGGRFALDFVNVPRVLRQPQRCNLARRAGEDGELLVVDEPRFNFRDGVVQSTWTFLFPDGTRSVRHTETRLYLPHDLVRLVEESGFVDAELFGSAAGEPFEQLSPRCVVVATRPRS